MQRRESTHQWELGPTSTCLTYKSHLISTCSVFQGAFPVPLSWVGTSYWSTHTHFVSVSYGCITKHPQNVAAYKNNHLFIISQDSVVWPGSAWRFFWSMWCWTEPQSLGGLTGLEGLRGSHMCLEAWSTYHRSISVFPCMASTWLLPAGELDSQSECPKSKGKAEGLLRSSFRSYTLHLWPKEILSPAQIQREEKQTPLLMWGAAGLAAVNNIPLSYLFLI